MWKLLFKFFVSVYSKLIISVQVLSDPIQRMIYDEIHGYSLTSINPFRDESSPKDHVFVDEFSCIGTVSLSRNYNVILYVHIVMHMKLFLIYQELVKPKRQYWYLKFAMLHVLIGLDVASLCLFDPRLEQFQGMLCNCTWNPWQDAKIVPM